MKSTPLLPLLLYVLLLCCVVSPTDARLHKEHKKEEILTNSKALAMPDRFSADVAMAVLDAGGNAIDAAIAAQFVLAVTFPEAGNIGGGGFMLIYHDQQADFLDYRETAPEKAHRDMYLDENGEVSQYDSIYGIKAAGIPGTVSGMWEAHKKYGEMPWATLLQPAIDLAEKGFEMPEALATSITRYINKMHSKKINVNFERYFAKAKKGEVFKQVELANTLKRIQLKGDKGFYSGETANIIVNFMKSENGLFSLEDLARYKAKWRAPIRSNWREYEVLSAAPPSSGGIAVSQWLRMFDVVKTREIINKGKKLTHNSAAYIHILAEIGKRVFADRAEYLGDPDFFDVPKTELLDQNYITRRADGISLARISATAKIKPGLPESMQTTHFSIVDQYGNAVSNTTTINLGFGSGVVVEGAGFLLNDEMDDFSAKAGVPNFFGAVGGEANEIQPFKRMLSSMTPSIVLENKHVKMVTGSPGGTTILSSVYLSILHAIEFGMNAQEVVDAPRFHHQLLPKDQIKYHKGLPTSVIKELESMGYTMKESRFGDLHVVINQHGEWQAASESSGRGKALVSE